MSIVEDSAGELHRCTTRRQDSYIVCGDNVVWRKTAAGSKLITTIRPRRNELMRSVRVGPRRVIGANIDQLAVVTGCFPEPSWEMVDQMLVAASALPCEAIVIINKSDLECHTVDLTTIADVYRSIGYAVLHTSAKERTGINELEAQLADKTTIFVGQSGMGKSSLISILIPHLDIRIGEVSKASGLGRHTTSNTTLYRLDTGGELIDSPGVRDFKPSISSLEQLTHGYIEFSAYLGQCRFRNCTHMVEPSCALIGAAKQGEISLRRLHSYQNLARDLGLAHGADYRSRV